MALSGSPLSFLSFRNLVFNSSGNTTSASCHCVSSVNPDLASGWESLYLTYGFISYIGVPSIRSAPHTVRYGASGPSVHIPVSFTDDSPSPFGRNGERDAKTPTALFPPRRGGLTVIPHLPVFPENPHISHR